MGRKYTAQERESQISQLCEGTIYSFVRWVDGYSNSKPRFICACEKHGEWELRFDSFSSNGSRCPECAKDKQRVPKQDREKQILKHCAARGYSFVKWVNDYVNTSSRLVCSCPEHGEWESTLNSLINLNRGCPVCGGTKKSNSEEFKNKSIEKHGDKYDYSKVIYVNNKTKVTIRCHQHGVFLQTPDAHLSGQGCPKCANNVRKSTEDFIAKARVIHGDKYDYSKVIYVNNKTKVTIRCHQHGAFLQTPDAHLSGRGCPGCAQTGFDQTKPATMYAIRSDCGQYVKIGIANNFEQRFSQLRRATPFDVFVIERIECDGQTARQFEKMFHDKFESAGFTGFDGATEWLQWSTELQYWLRLLK